MHVMLHLKHFPASGAPVTGGTAIAVDGFAAGLVENGAQVTVLCEGPRRSSVKTATGYTIECFVNRKRYRTFTLAPELQRHVAGQLASKRGLCLVNGMFHPGAYAMGRWLHRHGVPYVVAPHDPYDRAMFSRNAHLKWPYWYLFERRLLKQAQAIQVLDMQHAACLRRLGIDTAVIETPNGVAVDGVATESQLRWRDPQEPVHLVFLGRIDAYNKGLDILLDAFTRVSRQADVRLTVQGPDWGDRPCLEKQATASMITDRVAFRGPDYERSSPRIIGGHDVFCLPSRFEGFGLAALEAMVAARVLLVSERAGIARHVQASGCGVTVPPTVAGVEAGLYALLQRRAEWREMGLSGRRYALANLQWKNIAAAALDRYERLLD
jgi:glycosyltransferase involved in cell wall biosynthesis